MLELTRRISPIKSSKVSRLVPPNSIWLNAFQSMVGASIADGENYFGAWSGLVESSPERYLHASRRDVRKGCHRFWLVADGDLLGVGSATWPAAKWTGHVGFYIDPAHRGRGLGRTLIASMAEIALHLGARKPRAMVDPKNGASVRALLEAGAIPGESMIIGRARHDTFVFEEVSHRLGSDEVKRLLALETKPSSSYTGRMRVERSDCSGRIPSEPDVRY